MCCKITKKHFISFFLLFTLFGCVESYYVKKPKLIETNTVETWKELKVEVLEINEDYVVFHFWTEAFEKVQDSLEYEVLYNSLTSRDKKYNFMKKDLILWGIASPLLGASFIMLGKAMSGCVEGFSEEFGMEDDNSENLLYIMGGCWILGGAVFLYQGISLEEKDPKKMTVTRIQQKENSVKSLETESLAVSLSNTEFRKEYMTGKEGNVSISIEEISPYFSDELSRITFDFFYKDLSTQIAVEFR